MEPLDTKLFARAADLTRQEEDLRIEIAGLRRTAPLKAVEAWKAQYKSSIEADEEVLRAARENVAKEEHGNQLGIERLERQEEVERSWARGVEGLENLKKGMPGTAARMEGAKKAGDYVISGQ